MLRARCLWALAGGLLLPCAFAPYGLWPLAMLSMSILLWALRQATPTQAAAIGWVFGCGMFGHGVWWIQVSVHQFGVPYYTFSVSATALFIAWMAAYVALFAWLLRKLPAPGEGVRLLLLAPMAWVLIEWLRGVLFTGFPWLSLGYSQIDGPLAGFAPLAGVPACSLATVGIAAAVVHVPRATPRGRVALAIAVVITFALGGGLRTLNWTTEIEAGLQAALIQGAIPQGLKWKPEVRDRSLARYRALSEPHWDADVMIWPETAIPAFPADIPQEITALQAQAEAAGTSLLIGMPTGQPWNGRYFNSVVGFGPTPGQYDKRHLVPFGEFFPFKAWLVGLSTLLSIPMSDFSAGDESQVTLPAAGHLAGVSICYEDAFARDVLRALPQAAFLVNVSNDGWFGDTIAPHQHLEIARMRALESGRFLLRGTNTGISAVIDHRGKVIARAAQFEANSLRASFAARAGATPYVVMGDGPLLAILVVTVLSVVGVAHRRAAGAANETAEST